MQIILEPKVPFRMTLSIMSNDIEAHSAFSDLTKDERANIEHGFAILMNAMQDLMWERRIELGKDKR
jgi:hypothetical protein